MTKGKVTKIKKNNYGVKSMYNDLLNQLIINKIQGHKTFISINIASDFIIAFIIIFKNKLSYTRNDKINTGKMITTLLALLFIVKPIWPFDTMLVV